MITNINSKQIYNNISKIRELINTIWDTSWESEQELPILTKIRAMAFEAELIASELMPHLIQNIQDQDQKQEEIEETKK